MANLNPHTSAKALNANRVYFLAETKKFETGLKRAHWSHRLKFQGTERLRGFPAGSAVKSPPAMQETRVQSLGQEDPLEKGMATHSRTLAWSIPWTEGPGGLQSPGS